MRASMFAYDACSAKETGALPSRAPVLERLDTTKGDSRMHLIITDLDRQLIDSVVERFDPGEGHRQASRDNR
jgi:hypothetical protein